MAIETLTDIKRYTQDKNGNPNKAANGSAYTRVVITTREHGATQMSFFAYNNEDTNWKAGDALDIEVSVNGKYMNFKPAKAVTGKPAGITDEGGLKTKLDHLHFKIDNVMKALVEIKDHLSGKYSINPGIPDFEPRKVQLRDTEVIDYPDYPDVTEP